MVRIHFVIICEGSSDVELIGHLEQLCIDVGADEVSGTSPDFRRFGEHIGSSVEAKLRATLQLEPNANLIFIHRDADSTDPKPRYEEINAAVEGCRCTQPCIPIVPVQETEAWLLLDEIAIRHIAQRPNGKTPLNLPRPRRVESLAGPKEILKETLVIACELSGRRLARFKSRFSVHRQLLLQRLPIGGPLAEVSAWIRLREDLRAAIQVIRAAETPLKEEPE